MRAVNLIPAEERRARSGGGRSGGGVYVVLGVLALALVLLSVHTLTRAAIADKQGELAQVRAETAAAQREVDDLRAYTRFAELRQKRTATVASLVSSRFDWAHALREVARTLPERVWLSGLRGTVNPSVAVDGDADPLRSALPVPAIEMKGCSTGQKAVALLVTELRRIDGVQRVSLSESVKERVDAPGAGATAQATTLASPTGGRIDPCAEAGRPRFSLTIFFRAATPAAPAPAGTAAVSSPPAATP